MGKAKIFYFSLQDQQDKTQKLNWFSTINFDKIAFDHVQPDAKANWINLTNNDFDDFLPLIDKEVKAGKSESGKAIFQIFSRGFETGRDEWIYDFNDANLKSKSIFFINKYNQSINIGFMDQSIKWNSSLKSSFVKKMMVKYRKDLIKSSAWRPFTKKWIYTEPVFIHRLTNAHTQIYGQNLFASKKSPVICCTDQGTQSPFMLTATNCIPDLHLVGIAAQCLPLYRYDKEGNRLENITDWGLTQFQTHYVDQTIIKENIFHYVYAVLHNPTYRQKYE